jgi:hypothetical protein
MTISHDLVRASSPWSARIAKTPLRNAYCAGLIWSKMSVRASSAADPRFDRAARPRVRSNGTQLFAMGTTLKVTPVAELDN